MKTTSLNLSKAIASLGLEVESDFYWARPHLSSGGYSLSRSRGINKDDYPAYTLQDLPAVLKAIGEKKGWDGYTRKKYIQCPKCFNGDIRMNPAYCEDRNMPDGYNYSYCKDHQNGLTIWKDHFIRICELYAKTGELGEGSEVEKYLMDLLK